MNESHEKKSDTKEYMLYNAMYMKFGSIKRMMISEEQLFLEVMRVTGKGYE